jgi:putative transcriptional regulator
MKVVVFFQISRNSHRPEQCGGWVGTPKFLSVCVYVRTFMYICIRMNIIANVMYKAIDIDRDKLTLMGVPFPNLETLDGVANAIGSNMFEGFEPTAERITLIRDYTTDKITFAQFVRAAKDKVYAE